jgi:hypothetical protein
MLKFGLPSDVADTIRVPSFLLYLTSSRARRASYVLGLRAESRFNRAGLLRENDRPLEALAVAREGLDILRSPIVCRTAPFERILLLSLTRLAEDVSQQVGEPGPSLQDLRDSLDHLKRLAAAQELLPHLKQRRPAVVDEMISIWLPYLEARVGSLTHDDEV